METHTKRYLEEDPNNNNTTIDQEQEPRPKKKKALKFESLYLEHLPCADLYEKSYMHRDTVTHIVVSKTEFIITASQDGHIKFWKKQPTGIEFVKHFRAHLAPVVGLTVSSDGLLLCSAAVDQSVKIYDVLNFDMINMFKLPYVPLTCEFIFKKDTGKALLVCTDTNSPNIHIYDAHGDGTPLQIISLHKQPVHIVKYNEPFDVVISADKKGMIEYWSAADYKFPADVVEFQFKTDTDLYEFVKSKTIPTCINISSDGTQFATMGKDRQVRLFRFLTGKLHRKYDESLSVLNQTQKDDSSMYKLDSMEFGRRVSVEKEIDNTASAPPSNVIFDESGNFIMYPTMLGIKLVNVFTNKVIKMLGKLESSTRFLFLALYQGKTKGSAALENLSANAKPDPTLICTAFKKNRFYMFTRREPDVEEDTMTSGRDVLNERPTKEDAVISKPTINKRIGRRAVIHTTKGDIHVQLYPDECPKTVENFTVHSKNGYYNNVIFHRVIKGFVIQTGDPRGDGTGGESIWGGEFEDEFVRSLRHDKAGTLSMANAGPNTNGSQFFITCVPCPSLDNKHTVFGKVTQGLDVVRDIEYVATDKWDKPVDEVKVQSVTIHYTDD